MYISITLAITRCYVCHLWYNTVSPLPSGINCQCLADLLAYILLFLGKALKFCLGCARIYCLLFLYSGYLPMSGRLRESKFLSLQMFCPNVSILCIRVSLLHHCHYVNDWQGWAINWYPSFTDSLTLGSNHRYISPMTIGEKGLIQSYQGILSFSIML